MYEGKRTAYKPCILSRRTCIVRGIRTSRVCIVHGESSTGMSVYIISINKCI